MEVLCDDVLDNILSILGEYDDLTNVRQINKFMYNQVKPKHVIEKVSLLRLYSSNPREKCDAYEKVRIIAGNRGLFYSILGFKRKNAAQGEKYIVDNFTHIVMFQKKIIGLIRYTDDHILDYFSKYFIMDKFCTNDLFLKILKMLDIYIFNFRYQLNNISIKVCIKFDNEKWYKDDAHGIVIRKDIAHLLYTIR